MIRFFECSSKIFLISNAPICFEKNRFVTNRKESWKIILPYIWNVVELHQYLNRMKVKDNKYSQHVVTTSSMKTGNYKKEWKIEMNIDNWKLLLFYYENSLSWYILYTMTVIITLLYPQSLFCFILAENLYIMKKSLFHLNLDRI